MTLTMEDIGAFVDGYVDAALWSTSIEAEHAARHNAATGEDRAADNSMLDIGMTGRDIDCGALASMAGDCEAFMRANETNLLIYCDAMGPWHGTDSRGYREDPAMARAGHDFWLTRCGHGCGFWDRDLGELGDRLSDAARAFGEVWMYVGDDGKVYV